MSRGITERRYKYYLEYFVVTTPPCLFSTPLMKPALEAVQSITRNHRESTIKLVRAGGRADWLARDSNVVPPDEK